MKPYREQTYYELLEVPHTASMDEIRAAYERSVALYDPENPALYPLGDPQGDGCCQAQPDARSAARGPHAAS